MTAIDDARRTHDIATILNTKKRWMVCPLPMHIHHNNTASFSVFWWKGVQWFRCHGNCGAHGDVVDLVGYLKIPGYSSDDFKLKLKALELLENRFEVSIPQPVKETTLDADLYKNFLPVGDEVIQYAASRGLTTDTLWKFKVGQCGHYMAMPTIEEEHCVGIKMRNIKPGSRYWNVKGSRQGLFNFNSVKYANTPVLVVKGEIPCMLLDQRGVLSCAPTGGEGGFRSEWKMILGFAPLIVVGDNDDPGRKLGEKRRDLFGAKLVYPPAKYKDIDEWILADPSSIEVIQSWISDIGKENKW